MLHLRFLRFLLPLAITSFVLELGSQVLNAGMARIPQPAVTLASFGLAWGIVLFLTSPLAQAKELGLVLGDGCAARRQARRFVVLSGLLLTGGLAALLHDIGHICDPTAEQMADDIGMIDHEGIGARFLLERGFSAKVADLVRAHVAAKRYLVATNATYAAQLSPASTATLKHQGGPMSIAEVAAFERDPLFKDKLRMRTWDEMGKETGMTTPPLDAYRAMMVRHLSRSS